MYPLAAVAMKVHVSPQLPVTTVTFTDVPGASVPLAGVAVIPGPVNCANQFARWPRACDSGYFEPLPNDAYIGQERR
jgi:hypothetical protein